MYDRDGLDTAGWRTSSPAAVFNSIVCAAISASVSEAPVTLDFQDGIPQDCSPGWYSIWMIQLMSSLHSSSIYAVAHCLKSTWHSFTQAKLLGYKKLNLYSTTSEPCLLLTDKLTCVDAEKEKVPWLKFHHEYPSQSFYSATEACVTHDGNSITHTFTTGFSV